MTFYDVKHRQYQDYMNDVEKVKPYRGKVAKAYRLVTENILQDTSLWVRTELFLYGTVHSLT